MVQEGISRASGLDPATAGRLLALLAPVVMGALGRARQQEGEGSEGLSDLLAGAAGQLGGAAPAGSSLVAALLDANRDGSVLDDVARIGKGLLGGLFGRKGAE